MTSNGLVLKSKLVDLVAAGLNQLNISLDTLKEDKFEFISRRKGWQRVWECIDAAERLFNPLKVNLTILQATPVPKLM